MQNYLKLLRFLKAHKGIFFLTVVTMLFASFLEVFQMSLLVPIVDIVFTQKKIVVPNQLPEFATRIIEKLNTLEPSVTTLSWMTLGFILMFLIKNFAVFGYQYLMGDVSQRVMRQIRFQLYQTIQNLSLDYFSKKRTGELISRITHDTNLVENAVSYGVTDLFRQTFMIAIWILTALTIDLKAALIIFMLFPLIGFPMAKIGQHLRKISKGLQEKMADINTLLLETISGVKLVKAFCAEQLETDRFRQQNHDYYKLRMKAIKRLILVSPITEVIGGFLGVMLILWFGERILNGQLSFGVFTLFFASIVSIISPIKKLGNVNALTQQALAANQRIYEVLEAKPTVEEKTGAGILPEMKGSIKLEEVDFHYQEESGLVLRGINLEVKKGELVAIVGPTGAGKTTLVDLIPRFYDPIRGRVTIDGTNLRDVTLMSLRRQIGIVTQETILFNDTVRTNIAYGQRQATQQAIEDAAQKAFAHRFIQGMPQGYETIIGDRGFRLSGGEKQRLAIARAILKNPPILILDEATSQLDSESERYIQEALDQFMQGRTVVAIAHRLSTIKKASKIVVLENGKVVGMGRHEELLTTCPLYEKLYKIQFQT